MEHPGLRLKRSRVRFQALVSPAGRILGCVMTAESVMERDRPITWATLATVKSEGTKVPSVPLLILCVTKELSETAAGACSRAGSMDRSNWLGLLEPGEETVSHQAEQRTQQDLRPLTQ